METFREKLNKLKDLKKQASQASFREVLEENEISKRPVNWQKKLERKIKAEEERQKAEELGESYKLKKSLNIQADKVEKKAIKRQYNPPITEPSLIPDSREGVDRLVEDVNKQIEVKSKRSRRRRFDDDADVDYINERNMRFNKKLDRFYGDYTQEIKQNFERGTAI